MQNKLSIVILDKNPSSQEIILSYLQEVDFIDSIKTFSNYTDALEDIQSNNPLVIMDISILDDDVQKILDKIKLLTTKFIITSADYSTDKIIKALKVGAKEFLPKPVIKDELIRVLSSFINYEKNDSETSASKIISVYSNKGGIGKTTIAINLASELAKATGNKVALIDLNLQLGDVATFLNLTPTFDVAYAIQKFADKEENIFLQAFEKYKDTSLYILSDPSYIEQAEGITTENIIKLFNALKKVFPYIIIDMSSSIDLISLKILDLSDFIMFTTIITLPAIRNAQRCLTLFRSRNYSDNKVKIVVNRYMDSSEINLEDIENTLGQQIYWKIPNNYFTIMEAINRGVVVSEINATSNITYSFKDFAIKLSDDIIEQSIIKIRG